MVLYLSRNKKTVFNGNTISRFKYQSNSMKQLENMVLKDKATAIRLVEMERSLRPDKSEDELIQLAINRLVRDRR